MDIILFSLGLALAVSFAIMIYNFIDFMITQNKINKCNVEIHKNHVSSTKELADINKKYIEFFETLIEQIKKDEKKDK